MAPVAKIKAYLELMRIHNIIVSVMTTAIGYVAVLAAGGIAEPSRLAAASLAVALVAAGGYVINDYYDVETDSIVKPWRPIPSGRVGRREAKLLALALMAAGLVASATLGPAAFAFAAVNAVMVYEYSRWIKRTGFVGNLVVAMNSAATIIMGGLAASREDIPPQVLVPAAVAFTLVLGREIVKGIEDYRGDKDTCYMTLAVVLGPERAARIAAAVLATVVVLSPIPYLVGGYSALYLALALMVDAIVVYSIYALMGAGDVIATARKLRSYLKIAFAVGALAFLIGPM